MKKKTYKRELGFLMFCLLAYLAITAKTAVLSIVITPFMLYITAVFITDAAGKQFDHLKYFSKPRD